MSRMGCWSPYGLIFAVFMEIIVREDARDFRIQPRSFMKIVVLSFHQRDPAAVPYTHPVQLRGDEPSAVLTGFSFREKQRLPLRWFAEEVPPEEDFPLR